LNGNGSGHGLVGMRERVSLYGGTLDIEPGNGSGGFRVHATLPAQVSELA
jgi:signal transduction histidine kinase